MLKGVGTGVFLPHTGAPNHRTVMGTKPGTAVQSPVNSDADKSNASMDTRKVLGGKFVAMPIVRTA
jgi:hypothetical protein